ncbi:MAG: hypothetical protein JWQ90_5056 [Hydrocarboniphaga sp.]|uniref:hypothetical protein n=1 Tax=Hydrocarboniphaga sp. TaxID=2033016 RepID=UPI00260BD4E8|nr:hypothetical protein [Hydrocarboniphaga sp.]MDB5972606.1 hypothetical protein [Hydrocarboniphaga sp.]
MSQPAFDLTPFLHQDEGQHFDRKFLYEGREGTKRARDRRKLRDRSLLDLHPHGANSYYTLPPPLSTPAQAQTGPGDRGESEPNRGELEAGLLERRFPDTPTHPDQAYRISRRRLPFGLPQVDPA